MASRFCWLVLSGFDMDPAHYERALELAARAVASDPDCVEAYVAIGLAHQRRGEVDRSITALRRALDIDPNHPDALAWLVCALAEAGGIEEAQTLARHLMSVSPFERSRSSQPG